MRILSSTDQSSTTFVASDLCNDIDAECTSKYGCAVGQYNGNSFAKVSRDSETSVDAIETLYNYGQKFKLTLCPGFDSFVDIAPRNGIVASEDIAFKMQGADYLQLNVYVVHGKLYFVSVPTLQNFDVIEYNITSRKGDSNDVMELWGGFIPGSWYSTENGAYAIGSQSGRNISKLDISTQREIGPNRVDLGPSTFDCVYGGGEFTTQNGDRIVFFFCANKTKAQLFRINANGDQAPYSEGGGLLVPGQRLCGFVQYNASHGFLQTRRRCQIITRIYFRIYLSLMDLNAWKILGSKAVLGGKCDQKSFFACNNYMFNFVLENNNLYRLDAYDLSRDFREVSGDGFFSDGAYLVVAASPKQQRQPSKQRLLIGQLQQNIHS